MPRDNCYINYTKGNSKSKNLEQFEKEIVRVRDELFEDGVKFDTNIDGQTAVSKKVFERAGTNQKRSTNKFVKQLSSFEAVSERIDEWKAKTKNIKDPKKKMNAFVSIVFNTNDTSTLPFEQMKHGNLRLLLADFFEKLRKIDGVGDDPMDYLIKNSNFADVMTEYNQFFKNTTANKSITKNVTAFRVAKELFDAQFKIGERMKGFGKNMLLHDLRLRPKWSNHKIKKMDKQQFINEIADALDPEVHGDVARRQELASTLYDNMSKPEGQWRKQGDISPQNLKADNWLFDADDTFGSFAFNDGNKLIAIMNKYADIDMRRQIQLQFEEMARESALVQFLGADYSRALDDLTAEVNKVGSTWRSQYALDYLRKHAQPEFIEHNVVASKMGGIRGYMASTKLGAATITALLDIPAFIFSGRQLFGLPFHKVVGAALRFGFKGSPAEYRQYAYYMVEGIDSLLGHMNDRFGHIGSGGAGAFEEGGSVLANWTFKWSGLNWWTEGRKHMAIGIYGKELGDLIKTKQNWKTLGPAFRQNLEKFGVTEKDWKGLIRKQPIDENGRFAILQVDELDFEFSYGKSSLRQKMSAAFNDVASTMVMTPGDFDIGIGAFFNKPGSAGEQVAKTVLQFKTHPISYTRKIIARSFKKAGGMNAEFIANMAFLTTNMMLMAVVVTQLKEFLRGNQPRNWNDGNLWIRAAEQSGALGLWTDVLMQLGGGSLLSQFTDEPESKWVSDQQKASQLLGPFISDILKLSDTPIDITRILLDGDWSKLVPQTTQTLTSYVPFQNIWYAQMLKRWLIHDTLKEWLDPKGYKKQKKRMKKKAKDNRWGGKPNNIFHQLIE